MSLRFTILITSFEDISIPKKLRTPTNKNCPVLWKWSNGLYFFGGGFSFVELELTIFTDGSRHGRLWIGIAYLSTFFSYRYLCLLFLFKKELFCHFRHVLINKCCPKMQVTTCPLLKCWCPFLKTFVPFWPIAPQSEILKICTGL